MRKSPKLPPRAARQITRQLDESLGVVRSVPRPSVGWVRTIRQALGMTQKQLAARLDVTRRAVSGLESDEIAGRVTLDRLRRVADALGCELQYHLVPRVSLEDTIARQASQRAASKLARVHVSQTLEASPVASTTHAHQLKELADEMRMQRASDLWDE